MRPLQLERGASHPGKLERKEERLRKYVVENVGEGCEALIPRPTTLTLCTPRPPPRPTKDRPQKLAPSSPTQLMRHDAVAAADTPKPLVL